MEALAILGRGHDVCADRISVKARLHGLLSIVGVTIWQLIAED